MGEFFGKIDPNRVFERMYGDEPIEEQKRIFESMENYQHTVVAATRRGGKTKSAAAAVIAMFLRPGTETMVLAPQHSLTDNIFFNNVYKFLRDNQIPLRRKNLKDRILEGEHGSVIYARSLQRAESIVGVGLDLAVLDEIALTPKDEFWVQELEPTLTEKIGHTLWISTPRGYNHFKDKYDDGLVLEEPDWNSITYTVHDLPYIDPEYVKKLEAKHERQGTMPYFRQEYLASFEAFEGQIYPVSPITDQFDKDMEFEMVIGGLDIGFNHSTAFVVVGVNDYGYFILDYYVADKRTTEQHAEKIKAMEEKYDIEIIYIDSAAAQSAWDMAVLYDITTMKANKAVLEGIARIQTLLGDGKVYVHPDIWEHDSLFRRQMSTYRWDEEKEKPWKFDDDLPDALRYAIYTFDMTYNMLLKGAEDESDEGRSE